MPQPVTPPYPSFTLVISEAYIQVREPERRPELPLPSRFHPYTRSVAHEERYVDEYMTTVDYRWSPPPVSAPVSVPTFTFDSDNNDEEDIMAVDGDHDSVESYFFALNNLDHTVRGEETNNKNERPRLGRRPSLSTLVIELAFLVKGKFKWLKPTSSTSTSSRASQK